jgi:hypothetical protein
MREKNINLHICHLVDVQNAAQLEHLQPSSLCNPAKLILTSNFSYLFNSNPTHETKIGTVKEVGRYQWQPSGLIIMIGQSKIANKYQSNHIYYSSLACVRLCCTLYLVPVSAKMLVQNHFAEPNRHG